MSEKFEKAEIDIYHLSSTDIVACSADLGPMDGPILEGDEEDLW